MEIDLARPPAVAVVIPAKNEEASIETTIESVKGMDYPAGLLDIIVVDNGSEDATAEVAKQSGATVIERPGILVGAVRNRGAAVSSGSILVFLDADVTVKPDYLYAALKTLKDESVGAVGGRYTVSEKATWIERAWVVERKNDASETDALPGGSFVVKRSIFEQTGGFSETLAAGEDDELTRRIVDAGYRVISIRGCDVEHMGYPSTLPGIFRRQVWHGSSQLDSAKTYRDPILLLTHGFGGGLVAAPLALYVNPSIMTMAGAIAIPVALCGIAAFAKERKSNEIMIGRLLQRTILYCPFLLGRTFGLINNYWRRIAARMSLRTVR